MTLIFALIVGFLFLIPTSYATDTTNSSHEIERVEIGEGSKIIYYKDGSREVFFTCSANVGVDTSVETKTVYATFPIPKLPDPTEIFKIIKQILDLLGEGGVGSTLLAWTIWNCIKNLRRNRPRDYNGVGTIFK